MSFHLAQVNIARMNGTLDEPVMSGLAARIEEMNRLAEESGGFVWRARHVEPSALGVFAGCFQPFEASRLFYNLSVWESVEALKNYAFKTAHAEMLREKARWTGHFNHPHLALWWVTAGRVPTVEDSALRLRSVRERGPTEYAFTFQRLFPPPASVNSKR